MSTLKVNTIKSTSTAAGGISIAADGSVSGALPSPNRNLLYNGAMQVAQRGTSTAGITSGGYYTADRFAHDLSSLGTWTQSIENDAPSGSGLRRSLKYLCTSADSSPSASDRLYLLQVLEGQDVQRIAKGTASAQQLTLSFWVKSNVTGAYRVEIFDADNTRQVSGAYAISASATWERKTITFPADTTGALDNDNSASLYVNFWLGAGSNYTSGTLNTSWAASTDANRAVGQTNLAAATNNYWQITGVQLEVGPVATSFEFKSYGQELRECQRYYQRTVAGTGFGYCAYGNAIDSTTARVGLFPKVTMRAVPTSTEYLNVTLQDGNNAGVTVTSITLPGVENGQLGFVNANVASGLTQYRPYTLAGANNAAGYVAISAEL